jgi:hypothetical protein
MHLPCSVLIKFYKQTASNFNKLQKTPLENLCTTLWKSGKIFQAISRKERKLTVKGGYKDMQKEIRNKHSLFLSLRAHLNLYLLSY